MHTKLRNRRIMAAVVIAWFLCAAGTVATRADLPRPPKPAPQDNPAPDKNEPPQLLIHVDENAKAAHLSIPQNVLHSLANPLQQHSDARFSPASSVIAGIALTAAMVSSGLLLTRGRKRRGAMLWIIAIVGVGSMVATFASADLLPRQPRQPRPADPVNQQEWDKLIRGSDITIPVTIEAGGQGPIRLTITREQAQQLAPASAPTTKPAVLTPPPPPG